jgi:deoxyribodipyrimidine photo-lyase
VTALVWFTRDLRLHDNPALRAALDGHERVVPVFCFDPRLLTGRNASAPRTRFMLESLADLDGSLRDRGARLVIRNGPVERELVALAKQASASEVHAAGDVSPYARSRARLVGDALRGEGVELRLHPGNSVASGLAAIATSGGGPYTVFTPFHRAWLKAPRRDAIGAPRKIPMPGGLRAGRLPSLSSLGLEGGVSKPMRGGESEGRARLKRFLEGAASVYDENQDALASDGVSRLSPYLRFGCISPAETEARLPSGRGPEEFARQLCWRDFFRYLLHHFPETTKAEFQKRYRDRIVWRRDEQSFAAWREGRTGYPLVDAAMRQLAEEGWMHNRARLLVGSFLTKHLGLDWRVGERWFMKMLLDGDLASNVGNWQWIASVGSDRQPVSRRILSPTRQQRRFDPNGEYVRRYVPELAHVPTKHLAEPWLMSEQEQRSAGCVIGTDYPAPIVDHAMARREALARYGEAR